MTKAVEGVLSELAPAVIGIEAEEQRLVDQALIELDGTDNKSLFSEPTVRSAMWRQTEGLLRLGVLIPRTAR